MFALLGEQLSFCDVYMLQLVMDCEGVCVAYVAVAICCCSDALLWTGIKVELFLFIVAYVLDIVTEMVGYL